MKNNEAFLYISLAIVFIVMVWSIVTVIAQPQYSQSDYQKALKAENSSNPCATPQGYTDEQWRTHMSHHPDRYAQCLNS